MKPRTRLTALAPAEWRKRLPLPPEVLVSALQDKMHIKPGRSRPAKATRKVKR